jgi:hypothetical protein
VHNICKTRTIHDEFHSLYADLLEAETKFFLAFSGDLWKVYDSPGHVFLCNKLNQKYKLIIKIKSQLKVNFNCCVLCYFTMEQMGNNSLVDRQSPEHDNEDYSGYYCYWPFRFKPWIGPAIQVQPLDRPKIIFCYLIRRTCFGE